MSDLISRTDDIIYRSDAIEAVFATKDGLGKTRFANEAKKNIENMPSAQPEHKSGKWIERSDGWDGVYYECSECNEAYTLIDGNPTDNLYNYCPNCGTRMMREEEE